MVHFSVFIFLGFFSVGLGLCFLYLFCGIFPTKEGECAP